MKTDNHYLSDKVKLRADHLPAGAVSVLDCFHGKGVVWKAVRKLTGRKIEVMPVEQCHGKMDEWGLEVHCDIVLAEIDLSQFNVVDLDAYGCPSKELHILFDRKYKGTVFVTQIQSVMNQMPFDLLCDLGFTSEMCHAAPVLCSKGGWMHFKSWLAHNGVQKIYHRSSVKKHYLVFDM